MVIFMEAEIYTWVKNIVVYMIINTIIMNLLGNKSYKKYVSIVSGMILVLIVISPLTKLLKLDDNMDYFLQFNDFAIESADFKNELYQVEEAQSDAIFSEYKEKIKKQVQELMVTEDVYLNTFQVTVDRKTDSSTFGEILSMKITASTETKEEAPQNIQIEKIDVEAINIGGQDELTSAELPSPMEINIKNKLADFYNIPQGNINISIQGG